MMIFGHISAFLFFSLYPWQSISQEWCRYPAGALYSCQEWCRNWPTESWAQRFPRCIIRRLFACIHVPHREGNSRGGLPLFNVGIRSRWGFAKGELLLELRIEPGTRFRFQLGHEELIRLRWWELGYNLCEVLTFTTLKPCDRDSNLPRWCTKRSTTELSRYPDTPQIATF